MKIVFLDENTVVLNNDIDLSCLQAIGEYEGFAILPEDDPLPLSRGAEVMIVNKVRVKRQDMEKLAGLGLICLAATGYDNVDTTAAQECGIHVANVAGYAKYSVAQHVFAMILSFATHVHDYHRDVQAGEWQHSRTFNLLKYCTFELEGKTMGIVGFGSIGRQVAVLAETFGMRVLVHDTVDITRSGYRNSPLDELFRNADILSLHCPLTEQTHGLINKASFKKMKKNALLINTARGGIVDEEALVFALESGMIAGAAVDTLFKEPPAEGNPLLRGVKNLLITPHTAWSTRDARQRLVNSIGENIQKYRDGDFEGFVV
jgi:glycerate dehydrogenase